jgi:hypothetical protein
MGLKGCGIGREIVGEQAVSSGAVGQWRGKTVGN